MSLLWTPNYQTPAKFCLPRAYVGGYYLGWWPGSTVIATGNPTIIQEHLFGGYQWYIHFQPSWWAWNTNSRYTLDWIVDDTYAIQPGTGAHVNVGAIDIHFQHDAGRPGWDVVFSYTGGGYFLPFSFPPGPGSSWFEPLPAP